MSFLKINDPAERDRIVAEFLKTKKNIQQNYLSEKLGDIGQQQELTKLYKPIIDSQSGIAKELSSIKENTIATTNALKALPSSLKAIQFQQQPAIEAYDDDDDSVEDYKMADYGPLAVKYLDPYFSNKKKGVDKTFGIHREDGKFYIGPTPITIDGDYITVGDKTYEGTDGLWEYVTKTDPDESIIDENDRANYKEILIATKAMHQESNPNKPRSGPGSKWKKHVKPIWEEWVEEKSSSTVGEGVVVIPQDPNALVPMLNLLMASFRAGNTGARNEIVGICDELLRQGQITEDGYKNLMLQL